MKTIKLEIELTYNDGLWHGKDKESIEWFNDLLLHGNKGDLWLHSNKVGDTIGEVKIISYCEK